MAESEAKGFRASDWPSNWIIKAGRAARSLFILGLSHASSNGVKAEYNHSDLFDKCRQLMDEWSGETADTK